MLIRHRVRKAVRHIEKIRCSLADYLMEKKKKKR